MQHTINCVSARSVAHETTTSNLLHSYPEGFNVGALEKKEIPSSRLPSYLIAIIRPYKASLCKLAALDRHPELDPN